MILRTCGNWALSSGGDGGRCALYSSYSRWRKVGPDMSNAMAQWVGLRSATSRRNVLRKP